MSSITPNPESVATTVAQVSAIKKRKQKSGSMGITNRSADGEVRDTTPGYAVSETVVNSLAQMKRLKGAKKLLVQQRQSDPTPLPLVSRRQGRSEDSDDLLLANQEAGSVSAPVSEDDQDETPGYAVSETVANSLAQMKHLKGAKKLLVQQRQSDPTPLPLALRRQGRPEDSNDLLLANQEAGSVSAPASEDDQDETPGYAVSETIANSLAQMKHLKGAKKLLVQQRQSDPTPLPLALRRQGRSEDSDDLLLANQEAGSVSAPVSEDDQDESDGDSSDDPGYRAFSELRREQDKENKKRVTPAPLPSPHPRKRQKRFTDPQEGAMRTSPIDEEGVVISTPPFRSNKSKGKRLGPIPDESEEEEGGGRGQENGDGDGDWEGEGENESEDEDGSEFVPDAREVSDDKVNRSRRHLPSSFRHGSMHSSDPANSPQRGEGEDESEDEDGSEFVPDAREVSDNKVNRSRRHLPSSFMHGSMHSSDPANSPQRGAVVVYNLPSAGNSPARRGSGSNATLVSANPSQRSQRGLSDEAEGLRAGPLDRRFDEDYHSNLQEVARINRLAKINRAAVRTLRKPTTFWTEEGTKALMQAIHDYGPSWAVIRDVRTPLLTVSLLLNTRLIPSHQSAIPSLEGRDNVQLKDKARNIKVDMIKCFNPAHPLLRIDSLI